MQASFSRKISWALATAVLILGSQARANPEIAVGYDARSMAMGVTGVASSNGAAGLYHNPAAISSTKRLDISLALSPYLNGSDVPLTTAGGTTSQFNSKNTISPLGFIGLSVRLHERVVVGAAGLMSSLSGAQYDAVPLSIANSAALNNFPALGHFDGYIAHYELRFPVAIKVTPWLDVGAAWRVSFANQQGSIKIAGQKIASQNGYHAQLGGAQAGFLVRPHKNIRIGFNYRSRTDIPVSGTIGFNIPMLNITSKAPYTATVSVPHHFSTGICTTFIGGKLNLAGDFKYWMAKDTSGAVDTALVDSMSGHIGAEYVFLSMIPVRIGYLIGRSSTAPKSASALLAPPGIEQGGTLGVGLILPHVHIDLMGGYALAGGKISQASVPGDFKAHTWLISASAAAHF